MQTSGHGSPTPTTTSAVDSLRASTQHQGELQPDPEPSTQPAFPAGPLGSWPRAGEDGPVADDFVRKLYLLLEDESLANIVCWKSQGNSFVIKDVNAFSEDILGRVFKYANFASFVRQLNKYDFHKIKSSDDSELDDHSWIFRHRDFRRGGLKDLENIRRKVPGVRTNTHPADPESPTTSYGLTNLHAQIDRMSAQQDELSAHIQDMDEGYVTVLGGLSNLQRSYEQRDDVMRQIMEYAMQMNDNGPLQ